MTTENREVISISELLAQASNDLIDAMDAVHKRPTENLLARNVETLAGHVGRAIGLLQMLALTFDDEPELPNPNALDGFNDWAKGRDDALELTSVEIDGVRRYLESLRDG